MSIADLPSKERLATRHPHGTRVRYVAGCRCAECRRANTQYALKREQEKRKGNWNGIVSAARARRHIGALSRAGVGRRAISLKSGVSQTILQGIKTGRRKNLRAESERRILTVRMEDVSPHALVPARQTWKLLERLMAMGMTKTEIASRLGGKGKRPALQIQKNFVLKETAERVEQLFRTLLRPPDGWTPRLDLTGERRGKLVALSLDGVDFSGHDPVTYWKVACDCGAQLLMTPRSFRHHDGCPRCEHVEEFLRSFVPAPDQEFTLQGFSHYREGRSEKRGQYMWDCLCKCGTVFKVSGHHISHTKRCPACSRRLVGERAQGKPTGRRKIPTAEIDHLLEQAYSYLGGPAKKRCSSAPTLRQIAERTGWKVSALKERATETGLSTISPRPLRPWRKKETAILESKRKASYNHIRTVLRRNGYVRARGEIRDKIVELDHLAHGPRYTVEEVVEIVGFSQADEVLRLSGAGKLRMERAEKDEGAAPTISRAELRSFLLNCPEEYSLARVDRVLFTLLVLKNAFSNGNEVDRRDDC